MINIHIGLDLSFESTGITFYNEKIENNEKIESNIEFHRLVRDKENTSIILNVNQHIYYSTLFSVDLNLKHDDDYIYENGINYSNNQINLTEKYFLVVKNIMKIIVKYFNNILINNNKNDINVYFNMEGSLLNGHDYNFQITINMLQGFLRAELIKFQLINNFNIFKFRIISPKMLKLFFARNGNADKKEMIKSFIENYDGKKLIPQIDLSNKSINNLNDIIDSFSTVVFNYYDLNIENKLLFNYKKIETIKKRKIKSKNKKLTDLIDENVLSELNKSNINSNILTINNIL